MRIALYAPFKPLDHPHPSGDLVIGRGIRDYLAARGHEVGVPSRLRSRWLYWRPRLWPALALARLQAPRRCRAMGADLWLTYHSYYKAPDLLGPAAARSCRIPYVIFQGIYSTKQRRHWRTWPGFHLNRRALLAASHVFTNRRDDFVNLERLLPADRLTYIPPGIYPEDFVFSREKRHAARTRFGIGKHEVVAASAAMFRDDVKTQGLIWLMETLARMKAPPRLLLAGDGVTRPRLEATARALGLEVIFAGRLPRSEMAALYSAADFFLFPGINESLGMVYLEAQSCGLPVAAFANGGIAEVVADGESGLLTPPFDRERYLDAVRAFMDKETRHRLGRQGAKRVRAVHDLNRNYRRLEEGLRRIVEEKK